MNLFTLEVGVVLEKRLEVLEALKATDSADGRLHNVDSAVAGLASESV